MTIKAEVKGGKDEVGVYLDDLSKFDIKPIVARLHSRLLQKARDVWDTGNFFRRWTVPQQTKDGWKIVNDASYAWVLWRGRRGKYGSLKWPEGGKPLLEQAEKEIRDALK